MGDGSLGLAIGLERSGDERDVDKPVTFEIEEVPVGRVDPFEKADVDVLVWMVPSEWVASWGCSEDLEFRGGKELKQLMLRIKRDHA